MTDSPLYQFINGYEPLEQGAEYSEPIKKRLANARKQGLESVRAIEQVLNHQTKIADIEAGVVIDLFLSYRAVKGWQEMIDLVPKMFPPLAATVMVQEQLGLALNRADRGEEAESALVDLIARRGPSSETFGILGRVYKDRWEAAAKSNQNLLVRE